MLIVDVLTNFFGQLIIMNNFAFDTLPLKWLEDTFPVGCWVGGQGPTIKLISAQQS